MIVPSHIVPSHIVPSHIVPGHIVPGHWRTTHDTGAHEIDNAPDVRSPKHQPHRPLVGQICFHRADDANSITRRQPSSTAC